MSNFWGPFFHFLGSKNYFFDFFENTSVRTEKLLITSFIYFLKFIYSEKATKFLQNLPLTFDYSTYTVKSKVKISQNFVAFSEYMNFKK